MSATQRKPDPTAEAERIAAIAQSNDQTPECHEAYHTYCKMLDRAIHEGHVWRPDLVLRLYPIIRDINDEIDECHEWEKRMQPIYEAADKVVDAFGAILDARAAMPAPFYDRIRDLLIEWFGEDAFDFRLAGEALREHSLRPTLGDAVVEHMLKETER